MIKATLLPVVRRFCEDHDGSPRTTMDMFRRCFDCQEENRSYLRIYRAIVTAADNFDWRIAASDADTATPQDEKLPLTGKEVVCARPGCGELFIPHDASHRFHASKCRLAMHKLRHKNDPPKPGK